MCPIEFDHRVLDSLPLPGDEDVKRVIQVLKALVVRRIMPHFKKSRGTDSIALARLGEGLGIERFEDDSGSVRAVSLLLHNGREWAICIHERVFDYLAFVIPSQPESRLGEGTPEERKVLAFAEFVLRHEIEHMLYPKRTEREVLQSDAAFGMDRRGDDPTFYRALRNSLADEMNGLRGEFYLALFDSAEQGLSCEEPIAHILNSYLVMLGDLPDDLLQKVFRHLDTELKTKILGEFYRKSRDTSYPLLRRTSFLQTLLGLFALLISGNGSQAKEVFGAFKDRWGLVYLFHELGLPEASVEAKDAREIFELFKNSLRQFSEETKSLFPSVVPAPSVARPEPKPPAPPTKSLTDRIEEAAHDPSYPPQVMEVINKNKLNAVGHSGSKYTELIETLLAIPWGKIQEIEVSPLDFEEGLNRTHYGLQKPKDIICDFFTNLIWRYRQFRESTAGSRRVNGSSFLFVGPPGVGKTSLAISIAENLGIPYHKLSLGGMHDEADLRGHSFTYEGSKPGAIVQGIIKMGVMNGMFIMDEADKTEKFAIATLLEILDPEQNHLFHDKYTQTTVDIDLSNFHFMLTANTLETVPPTVVNRCEVIVLDRYSVDEKVEIGRQHLIQRIRQRYRISEEQIFLDPDQEADLLRYLIKTYTHEAGVRELERLIRLLFLRVFRKEILSKGRRSVQITREKIKEYLETPKAPRKINDDDRVGEMMALGVNVERGVGSVIPVQATLIELGAGSEVRPGYLSMVHATGNIERIMDESRKVATTAIFHCAETLGIDLDKADAPIHLHFMGGSTPKDGPSAGGAIALALASVLSGRPIRREVAMTGEIDTQGRITMVGALDVKLETAYDAGCKTVVIPTENLYGEGGVERLSDALKHELQILTYEAWKRDHDPFNYERHTLQIVAVDNIVQAAEITFIDEEELKGLQTHFLSHARSVAKAPATACKTAGSCFSILYVKSVEELELETIEDFFWENCACVLLVRPEAKDAILSRFPTFGERIRLWEFDPARDDLNTALKKIADSIKSDEKTPIQLSMAAPFFFLIQQGVCLEGFGSGSRANELRFFANNYTAQGVKIKGCKAALNRAYHYLSQMEPELLRACPFLSERDGIYVVDLSFIPEKYRLDVIRAEKILNAGLKAWLTTVESAFQKTGKEG